MQCLTSQIVWSTHRSYSRGANVLSLHRWTLHYYAACKANQSGSLMTKLEHTWCLRILCPSSQAFWFHICAELQARNTIYLRQPSVVSLLSVPPRSAFLRATKNEYCRQLFAQLLPWPFSCASHAFELVFTASPALRLSSSLGLLAAVLRTNRWARQAYRKPPWPERIYPPELPETRPPSSLPLSAKPLHLDGISALASSTAP